jgi:hypothetical protein
MQKRELESLKSDILNLQYQIDLLKQALDKKRQEVTALPSVTVTIRPRQSLEEFQAIHVVFGD